MKTLLCALALFARLMLAQADAPSVYVQHVTKSVCHSIQAFVPGLPRVCQENVLVMVSTTRREVVGFDVTIYFEQAGVQRVRAQYVSADSAGRSAAAFTDVEDIRMRKVVVEPQIKSGPSGVVEF